MNAKGRGIRGALGASMSALMLVLSVASPVLERADLDHEAAVESRHDPARCAPGHDHTLCTQVGAHHALPAREDLRVPVAPVSAGSPDRRAQSASSTTPADGHPTRAPPSV